MTPRPDDYRLILPQGWFRIDLEPGTREKSVAVLVQRQFRGADNAPHLKKEARERLLATAQDAFRNGGVELYVSLQTVADFPLSAALVVTLTPPHEQDLAMVTPVRLAETLNGSGAQVSILDLPAGQAVRVRSEDPPVTSLDIHIPIPGSSAYLLLSFSTPLAPLADALVGMFDAIAGTLRWIP
jgi:hypothetical protein